MPQSIASHCRTLFTNMNIKYKIKGGKGGHCLNYPSMLRFRPRARTAGIRPVIWCTKYSVNIVC